MTTLGELLHDTAAILEGATDAADQVYTAADWPTHDGQYPVLLVEAPHELRESLGNGTIEFRCTGTVRITLRHTLAAQGDDAGARLLEHQLDRLEYQVLAALVGSPDLMRAKDGRGQRLSQFPTIETTRKFSSDAEKHFQDRQIDLAMEYFQGPEDFYDPGGVPLRSMDFQPNTDVAESLQGDEPRLLVTFPQT